MTDPAPAQATPPAAPPAPVAAEPTPPVAAPVPTPPVAPPATPPAQPPQVDANPEAEKWKALSRKNEDNLRETRQQLERQQAVLRTLAEKVGVEFDDKPDPEKLAAQVVQAQADARQRAVELAVYRAAANAGANADLLLDSRAFMAKAGDLDPSAPDFADRVKEYATQAVQSNPTLAAQQQPVTQPAEQPPAQPAAPLPASSGGDFSGAPGGQRPWTEDDIANASPEALVKAMNDGLLAHMGIGRSRSRFGH